MHVAEVPLHEEEPRRNLCLWRFSGSASDPLAQDEEYSASKKRVSPAFLLGRNLFLVRSGGLSSTTLMPKLCPFQSLSGDCTALSADSVCTNSTRAQTIPSSSGRLATKLRTSAGTGFPGRRIRTRAISP